MNKQKLTNDQIEEEIKKLRCQIINLENQMVFNNMNMFLVNGCSGVEEVVGAIKRGYFRYKGQDLVIGLHVFETYEKAIEALIGRCWNEINDCRNDIAEKQNKINRYQNIIDKYQINKKGKGNDTL